MNNFGVTHLLHEVRSPCTDVCAQLDTKLDVCSHWFTCQSRCSQDHRSHCKTCANGAVKLCTQMFVSVVEGHIGRPRHQERFCHCQTWKAARPQQVWAEALALWMSRLGGGRSETVCLSALRCRGQARGLWLPLWMSWHSHTQDLSWSETQLGCIGLGVGSRLSWKHLVLSARS